MRRNELRLLLECQERRKVIGNEAQFSGRRRGGGSFFLGALMISDPQGRSGATLAPALLGGVQAAS